MHTGYRAPHSVWYEISAQGTGPLANTSENFLHHRYCTTDNVNVLFELRSGSFRNAALFKQGLLDSLL